MASPNNLAALKRTLGTGSSVEMAGRKEKRIRAASGTKGRMKWRIKSEDIFCAKTCAIESKERKRIREEHEGQ